MSGVFSAVATDVLALDATDVAADTTDVLSSARAASGGSFPAIETTFTSTANTKY